jgi:hypothetical protein
MNLIKNILTLCFILSMTAVYGQSKKVNENFIGYWKLQEFNTKMVIFERAGKLDAVVIDWTYCNELKTLKFNALSKDKVLKSTVNPINDYTVISNLELINNNELKETITSTSNDVVYWYRIK